MIAAARRTVGYKAQQIIKCRQGKAEEGEREGKPLAASLFYSSSLSFFFIIALAWMLCLFRVFLSSPLLFFSSSLFSSFFFYLTSSR